jgi:hypothetical protein
VTLPDAGMVATVIAPVLDRRMHRHRGNAELRDAFPALIAEWEAYWQEQPWYRADDDRGPDPLFEVLRAILDAAMSDQDGRQVHDRLLGAALSHGEQRHRQGVSDEALLGEYHAVRKALWRYLIRSSSADEGLTAILRVDVVISAASGLALRGFMRAQLPDGFPWERELTRTMADVSDGLARALR